MADSPVTGRAVAQILLLITLWSGAHSADADANSDYNAGADFARHIQGQGEEMLKNFKPEGQLPNYTPSPAESRYYGGVSAAGDKGLVTEGVDEWANSDVGNAVNDSVLNNPKEPLSPQAPFIETGKETEADADHVVGETGEQCHARDRSRTDSTNYTCERDLHVEQYCTRSATITGDWTVDWENKDFELHPTYSRKGKQVVFSFILPEGGAVISARLHVTSSQYLMKSKVEFMNTTFFIYQNDNISLNVDGMGVAKGQVLTGTSCSNSGKCTGSVDDMIYQAFLTGRANMLLKITLRGEVRKWVPRIEWKENCPFAKAEGELKTTECIEPGGNKTRYVENQPYTLYQPCWAYQDTYLTQVADPGSCKPYMDNPACTLATRQCAFSSEEGVCLHEYATYSCETKTSGKELICGGDIFCLDGECDKAEKHQSNDFAQAVSQLAAVAAAGKDVSALNGVDVRAFTGQARFCKKFAVGLSNCCKDSGWGQDIGLANCSSDEKALAKAKEKNLTVSTGEFCARKVLGVCLEKKRSYCQFDSKLAQIVQQQGRAGQLGIGFGRANHPDCRGVTVEELQRINFARLDFSHFFDDLLSHQNVPSDNELLDRVKEQITHQLQTKTSH